jgi:phage terminase large subunit
MKISLRPTYKQHLAYEALKKYLIVFFGGGAGGGKSWWLCESRLVNCYLYPGYKSFIAREELKRLMASTYLTWCKVCAYHQIPKDDWSLNGQYNFIEFKNGSRIDLLDVKYLPSDPLYERFGSLEYSDGAIEETGEIHFLAYDVLKTRINRHLNNELDISATMSLTGNPKKNWTYINFYLPFKNGTLPNNTKFIQALYNENPYTAKEYGKQLDGIKDKTTKERLMFGNWDYDQDPTALIDYEMINNMFSNIYIKKGSKKIVSDIARYGSDRAIITLWEGFQLTEYIIFDISSTEQIKNAINALRIKHNVQLSDIVVDEDGVGGGVVDGLMCRGFVNNSKAPNPVYQNLKSECGYKLAEMANQIYIECELPDAEIEMIRQELGMLKTYDADKDGKLRILPKEKIKENIGRSPDWLDVFIMRMYCEVVHFSSGIQTWHS